MTGLPTASDGDASQNRTSLSLLDRARGRDEEAWRRLVALYQPLVLFWCRRSGFSNEDAHDVAQEVFAAVSRRLADFRRDNAGGTFRGWLRVITINKIRDHARRHEDEAAGAGGSTARLQIEQVAGPESADDAEAQVEIARLFQRALDYVKVEFEPKTWSAFWGMALDSRTAAELATELGMTAGAVRQAKYKVMQRLREELGDVLEWPGPRT